MRISDWSSDVCSSDLLVIGLRWYLARAKDGYLRENASYSQISETLTESTEGARTIEALGIGHERVAALDADCAGRSEERRVGKEGVRTCSSRWWPYPYTKKIKIRQRIITQ